MTPHPNSMPEAGAAIGSQPATGAHPLPNRGPAVMASGPSAEQAQVSTTAQAIADLWADLDAHARLRQARESSAAMQSRQRFD